MSSRYLPWRDPNRVSWACWEHKHNRCDGWLITPGIFDGGSSARCECLICWHPKVRADRHLYESIGRGVAWNS